MWGVWLVQGRFKRSPKRRPPPLDPPHTIQQTSLRAPSAGAERFKGPPHRTPLKPPLLCCPGTAGRANGGATHEGGRGPAAKAPANASDIEDDGADLEDLVDLLDGVDEESEAVAG